MSGSLDSPIAKLERAIEHYRVLKFDFHGGVDRQHRPVTFERKRDGLEYCFRVGEIEPLNSAWPLVIGDAYYNLRAALDHLAYQLHVRHYRGAVPAGPPDDAEGDSQFPIWDTLGSTPLRQYRGIKRLGNPELTAIELLQPYKGWGTHYPPRRNVWSIRRALSDINMLNIIDKHRELHLVHRTVQSVYSAPFGSDVGFQQYPVFGKRLESNAYVDRWTFTTPMPAVLMNVHPGVLTAVKIDVGSDRIEVMPHLGGSIICIAGALGRFSGFFPPAAFPDLSWIHETRG